MVAKIIALLLGLVFIISIGFSYFSDGGLFETMVDSKHTQTKTYIDSKSFSGS